MRSRSVATRRAGMVAALGLGALGAPGALGALGALSTPAFGQDARPAIAVMPFDNGGSYGQDQATFDALRRGIAGMLISELGQNPAARLVARAEIQKLLDQQGPGASGRVEPQAAAKVGKLVGARYLVLGTFTDFYGDVRVDARLVSAATGETVKVEKDEAQRDHLYEIIRDVAGRLMKDANLPPVPTRASAGRAAREIPTEALTDYARGLLFEDRGDMAQAAEMYQKALAAFPSFTEAEQGLARVKRS